MYVYGSCMSAILEEKIKQAVIDCVSFSDPVLKQNAQERLLELQEELDMQLVMEDAKKIEEDKQRYIQQLDMIYNEMQNEYIEFLEHQKSHWQQLTFLQILTKLGFNLSGFREPIDSEDYVKIAAIANYGICRRILLVSIDGEIINNIGKNNMDIQIHVQDGHFVYKK